MAALKYALTHDPIIFDSLVKQFWSIASLKAPELGPPAILATIDRTPHTITEVTVRSQLQLGDDGGIEDLPIADIYLGDHMPLLAVMLPPAQAAIADAGTGEAAPDVPQTIPESIQETRPEPDQSQEHIPTLPRPTTSVQIPLVSEQGHTSDLNIASFSGAHKSDPDLFTSINVEDETLGGSFHTTPPMSTVIYGYQEDGGEPDVDLDALNALANAAMTVDSTKSPGGPSKNPVACSYDPTSDVPTTEVPSTEFPTDV
ncbi:hypothetical protein Tco_1061585, partial [Tanacetum coccineum]